LAVARGWGRSEEDLEAEKEQARQERGNPAGRRSSAEKKLLADRRSLELSLARIREQLSKVRGDERRRALETAKADLEKRLEKL
jgi:50S ribosomal subunit-associated GTPase HflX